MNYSTVLINFYSLIINQDAEVNKKGEAMGKKFIKVENILPETFKAQMLHIASIDKTELYKKTLIGIKGLSKEKQIRCLAWLCVIGNADGFMDKMEWKFIYDLYHKELNLPMENIMEKQRELLAQLSLITSSQFV